MAARVPPPLVSGGTMQHFPEIQLTFQEARVLGCLLEKEILVPGSYPLTHNSLLIACNQTSSRDPITHFTGEDVSEALRGLSEKYLVEKTLGGRAPKFGHCIQDVLSMQPGERAVLTVLLLRGPQSTGEIRQRTDRMHTFASLDEVEETLTWFIEYPTVRSSAASPSAKAAASKPSSTSSHPSPRTLPTPPRPRPTPPRITIGVPPSKHASQHSNPRSPSSKPAKRRRTLRKRPSLRRAGNHCQLGV